MLLYLFFHLSDEVDARRPPKPFECNKEGIVGTVIDVKVSSSLMTENPELL